MMNVFNSSFCNNFYIRVCVCILLCVYVYTFMCVLYVHILCEKVVMYLCLIYEQNMWTLGLLIKKVVRKIVFRILWDFESLFSSLVQL